MTTVDRSGLGMLLLSRGRHMPRTKFQRPTVHLWKGKSGEKFWKVDYYVYIEGRATPKHCAKTWRCSEYTKAKAQEAADKLVRQETSGPPRADGSMTVAEFWDRVFFPVRSRRIAPNSQQAYQSSWRTHVEPGIGKLELRNVTKMAIDTVLSKIADAGLGKEVAQRALVIMSEMLIEAVENDFIAKNPCRAVELPTCKPPKPTRPLTLAEVQRLFSSTSGRDRMVWRVLILCGLRISEVIALRKSDVTPGGLIVDESGYEGEPGPTKNRKTRLVPLPAPLRRELAEWADQIDGDLIFPAADGTMLRRKGRETEPLLNRARKIIPDLTFRMCRTTFATLYDGDPRDLQESMGHFDVKLSLGTYRKPQAERQQASADELEARASGKLVTMEQPESFNQNQTERKSG